MTTVRSSHSLAKYYQPVMVLGRNWKESFGNALVIISALWYFVSTFSTAICLFRMYCRKWCNWTAKNLVGGLSFGSRWISLDSGSRCADAPFHCCRWHFPNLETFPVPPFTASFVQLFDNAIYWDNDACSRIRDFITNLLIDDITTG